MNLLYTGYDEQLSDTLKYRVVPTNLVTMLIFFGIGLPFTILSAIYFSALTFIPITGCLICVGVMVANYYDGIRYSRVVISLTPVTTGFLYNMLLCGPQDDPIPSVYLTTLAFSLIPFVTIDIRERGLILFCSMYCFFIITGFPVTREWITLAYDTSILREGWLSYMMVGLGVVLAMGFMLGISIIGINMEQQSKKLKEIAEEKNQKLSAEQEESIRKTQELQQAHENERKQQWISSGISKISEIIRVKGNDETIFDAILQNLIKYLNVTQGGLFIVNFNEDNPEDTSIHLVACYAYERKKYVSREVHPGEGMLGQAYLEKMPSYYHEVPDGYVKITSGLGQAQPRCLLIVPLMVNDVVEGLIELASFSALEDYQQTFVEQVGEVIAAYIQSNRNVRRMQDLLSRAQEQAEELSAQEEEIRQNMEEMQATHEHHERTMEEMQRERDELLEKIATLEGQEV